MNVFISWSGLRSKEVANFLSDWLRCVIQATRPWISTKDLDRGSLWFGEINDQLKETSVGVICLTKENKDRPWILFEAGALAKGLSTSRVCTFLIDLTPADLVDPLAQFNHTLPNQEGVFELVKTLNRQLGANSLPADNLQRVFLTYWPQFETGFNKILEDTHVVGPVKQRTEGDMLSEILESTRMLHSRIKKLERENDKYIESNYMFEKARNMAKEGIPSETIYEIVSSSLPAHMREQLRGELSANDIMKNNGYWTVAKRNNDNK